MEARLQRLARDGMRGAARSPSSLHVIQGHVDQRLPVVAVLRLLLLLDPRFEHVQEVLNVLGAFVAAAPRRAPATSASPAVVVLLLLLVALQLLRDLLLDV